jgi:alkylhydroperoxidase/carboxymuconolactone decarboxylase family protein YurZ
MNDLKDIMREAPEVAGKFFELTEEITKYSTIDLKTKELILIGIFTSNGGIKGIGTHIERALKNNATKEEIIGSILFAMPVCGVSNVNLAIKKALDCMEKYNNETD